MKAVQTGIIKLDQIELSTLLDQYRSNPLEENLNNIIKSHCDNLGRQIRNQIQFVSVENLPVFSYNNCILVFGFVEKVLDINPKNTNALRLLETLYRNLMINDRGYIAIKLHEGSIMPMMKRKLGSVYEKSVSLHLYISKLYCACGKFKDSIRFAQDALKLNPKNDDAHVNIHELAQAMYFQYKAYKLTEASATGEQKTTLEKTTTYLRYAMVNMYREALMLAPQVEILHYNFGILLQNLGRNKEACKHFETAREFNREKVETNFVPLTDYLLKSLEENAEVIPMQKPTPLGSLSDLAKVVSRESHEKPTAVLSSKRHKSDNPQCFASTSIAMPESSKPSSELAEYVETLLRQKPAKTLPFNQSIQQR